MARQTSAFSLAEKFEKYKNKKNVKIFVKAKPNAKENKVEETGPARFTVAVKEPPKEGRANAAIAKTLAEHFKVPTSKIRLVSGFSSRNKIFEI